MKKTKNQSPANRTQQDNVASTYILLYFELTMLPFHLYTHTTQGVFKIGLSAVSVNIELNKSNKRYVGQKLRLSEDRADKRYSPGFLRIFHGTNEVESREKKIYI